MRKTFLSIIFLLILLVMPFFIEKKLKLDLPNTLQIIVMLFIFAAEILGEINSFYTKIPMWDNILHTINGFVMGAIGLSLIELLNESKDLKIKLDYIITDAMPIEEHTNIPSMSIIKGDAKSITIAAASVIAKVTRDRIMYEEDKKHPEYEFCKHKGYPTKKHIELLNEIGVPFHISFC